MRKETTDHEKWLEEYYKTNYDRLKKDNTVKKVKRIKKHDHSPVVNLKKYRQRRMIKQKTQKIASIQIWFHRYRKYIIYIIVIILVMVGFAFIGQAIE